MFFKRLIMFKHFKVVLEEEAEGGYSAFVPALPGCASQGETVKETMANIRDAMKLYVWSLNEDKLPVPETDIEVMLRDVAIAV
jgi:predicted RNase H-like HicB family nuclease